MSAPTTVTAAIFDAVADWSLPMLTFYDDATGERTELSAATLGNWAAKTANFVTDELGVAPGDSVIVDLPHHWQSAAILLGCWWAGADVHLRAEATDPVAVFTSSDRLDDHDDVDEVVVASLDAFALPVRGLPPGVTDFSTAVRVHGDQFTARVGSPQTPALNGSATSDVLGSAARDATNDGVRPGARVLSTRPWDDAESACAGLISVLAAGASLISVANADPNTLARKATVEKATLTVR